MAQTQYHDLGLLFPSEAAFKRPGAYGEFLAAQGVSKTNYVAQMDQFFENLTEQKRQFDLTLGFKEKELASRETLTREGYDLQKELQQNELEYYRWLEQQKLNLENKKLDTTEKMFDKAMSDSYSGSYQPSYGYGQPYKTPNYGPEGGGIIVKDNNYNPSSGAGAGSYSSGSYASGSQYGNDDYTKYGYEPRG
jgi:hypothetical protein